MSTHPDRTDLEVRFDVAPAGAASSAPESGYSWRHRSLPPSQQRTLRPRLGMAGLVYAVAYTLAMGLSEGAAHLMSGTQFAFHVGHPIAGASIAFALAVGLLARRSWVTDRTVERMGYALEVVGAFGIALVTLRYVLTAGPGVQPFGVSWACIWIVSYPMLVPSTPRRALIASTLAAGTLPLAIAVWILVGDAPPADPQIWVQLTIPAVVCAVISAMSSSVLFGFGREVHKVRQMGAYQLDTLLGRGGMGEVWAARHRMLARPAAVKLIRPDRLGHTPDASIIMLRFEREARATARLGSPHTVEVYDFGLTDDGVFYYVMELLDGLDVQTLVERHGPLPPERAVFVLRQVCHSLAEAHVTGFVHRDVKPANIFVARKGLDLDFAKVLDFGLVKPVARGADATALTAENVAAGTPAFMAPEMVLGETADPRTDIYALGCVAFWMLTGGLVFEAETPMKMLMAHVQTAANPPSTRTELPIPSALDAVVLHCLEKDPEARPRDAGEVMRRLDAIALDAPWTPDRARVWWDAHAPARTVAEPSTRRPS